MIWEEQLLLCRYQKGITKSLLFIEFQEYGKPVYSYSTNPDRRFSSSTSQHFKMSPPFASSEGVSAIGDRLQSDGVQDTHLLPHS